MNLPADDQLKKILQEVRVIAVVGLSPKPDRASYRVAHYLQSVGYQIIPIRPMATEILGAPCYASLTDIPPQFHVDLVCVFRQEEFTPPIAQEAVQIGAKILWLQLGISNESAMQIARQAGLTAIQDACLMVEHRRVM
ncbi:MAG: CoA-binding protein [Magnetococcus sp. DMHC-6]